MMLTTTTKPVNLGDEPMAIDKDLLSLIYILETNG